jgi:hypothetical protein
MVNTVFQVDYVAPDRYRSVAQASVGDQGSARQEMIVVGKDAYVKMPEGTGGSNRSIRNKRSFTGGVMRC